MELKEVLKLVFGDINNAYTWRDGVCRLFNSGAITYLVSEAYSENYFKLSSKMNLQVDILKSDLYADNIHKNPLELLLLHMKRSL